MDAPSALRAWRGDRALVDVAPMLKCDPSYISYLERGKRTPTLEIAIAIQKEAGIPAEDWLDIKSSDSDDDEDGDPRTSRRGSRSAGASR